MPYTRTLRRNETIRINGPATIKLVQPGRAKLSIDAPREVRIEHHEPCAPDVLPLMPPPGAGLDAAA